MSANFVADVGGTNIRISHVKNGQILQTEKYLCADFATIADAISHFQAQANIDQFVSGCIAIACPVSQDIVKMTNHSWIFSKRELAQELGLDNLYVINDFTAVAHSLPVLDADQLIQIGGGERVDKGNVAVFGPGTGLGVEHMTWTSSGWQTLDGEGGHVDFAPTCNIDIIVWHYLLEKFGRASAEEVLSGRGIVNIYRALAEHAEQEAPYTQPSEITHAALNANEPLCIATLQQFCRVMGSFAGNLALNLCTSGGVFIGGGIAGKLGKFFLDSDFRERFEAKGQFAHYVQNIPTFIIDEPDHGLLGALAYLEQQLKSSTDNE